MAAVLLDTTVLIDLLRGRLGARSRMKALRRSGDDPFTCAVNVEEIFRGLRANEGANAGRLISGLRIVPLGAAEGRQAGRWRQEYAEQGRTLAQADCLIAAAALAIGGRIATGNPKDFPMRGLAVEHWPAGA